MTDSGWDDWGTPDRVLRSLDEPRARELRARLAGRRTMSDALAVAV